MPKGPLSKKSAKVARKLGAPQRSAATLSTGEKAVQEKGSGPEFPSGLGALG